MNDKIHYASYCMMGLCVFSSARAQEPKKVHPQRPNIIFILADDMGYGDLGCYGQQKIETPNIDALARDGMRFTQFYASSPLSSPSRCCFFTGLHAGHSYIRYNDDLLDRGAVNDHWAMYFNQKLEGQRPMPKETVTFPSILQKNGYRTGIVGKWGLGYPGSESTPNKMGFDFFYGFNCQMEAQNHYPPFLYKDSVRQYLPNRILQPGAYPVPEGVTPDSTFYQQFNEGIYGHDLLYKQIESFVETSKDEPLFLAWTTTIPHMGLQSSKKWIDYYHKKFGDEAPYLGRDGYYPAQYPHATFAAMISTLDEQVGKLVAKLKELGIYDNTLIIFSSDNGSANKGGPDPKWFNSGGLFRADKGWGKSSLHEGGIRVPLIVEWPGHIAKGSTSDFVCAGWDFLATFSDLVKAKAPQTDGISFLPTLLGKKQKGHDFLYWEYPGGIGWQAVRLGDWKGILRRIKQGNTKIELYDMKTDVKETNNVADAHPDVVKKISKIMQTSHVPTEIKLFRIEK